MIVVTSMFHKTREITKINQSCKIIQINLHMINLAISLNSPSWVISLESLKINFLPYACKNSKVSTINVIISKIKRALKDEKMKRLKMKERRVKENEI